MRKRIITGLLGLLTVVLAGLLMAKAAFAEETWWNSDWQYRQKISLDTTPAGSDVKGNLSDVEVLVRLHSGNMNFTYAQESGDDLRFVAANNKTLLKFEIETYGGLDEMGTVWVRLPKVSGTSNQDYFWMYFGHKEATSGQDKRGTFGQSAAVFHFAEARDIPKVSSDMDIEVSVFSAGQGLPGVIGNGISLNGLSDRMVINNSSQLSMNNGFSVTTWIKIPTFLDNAVVFHRKDDEAALEIGVDQANLYARVTYADGQTMITEKTAALSPGTWHPVAVTGTRGGLITVYVDGIKIDWMNLDGPLPLFNGDMAIGSTLAGESFFTGELDEFRIYPSVLNDDRIRFDFASQGQDLACVAIGQEMADESGGLPIFYLGTVFRNITLDGWLIIIILMALGVMSWVVILSKGITLHLMGKENEQFREITGKEKNLFKSDVSELENSSLSRLYTLAGNCLDAINEENGGGSAITHNQKEQFKSDLEKGLVSETVRMNASMTVLTMAISGGPFLGLLGTVWGVMNTFAAMAEAGEANIMAIAPGVASALSTTVFGLIVAIPALFGYNYLSTKIRQVTIDLNMYTDELILVINRRSGGKQ